MSSGVAPSTSAASARICTARPSAAPLTAREARDGELARVGAGEARVRVPVRVVADAHVDRVGRAAEDVGDDLRGRRLVALALRRRAERDHDLAEDVELDGRDLAVARELQLRVEVAATGRSCSCPSRASSRSRSRAACRAPWRRRAAPRARRSRSARARRRARAGSRRSRRCRRSASRTASARAGRS